MADNLKITTPVTMGDHTAQVKGNKNATPIGNIDPTRVFSKDPNAQAQDRNTNLQWNSSSVLQSFVAKMKETPILSQTIGKLLTGSMADIAPGVFRTDAQQALAELAQTSVMDKNQMLENLLFQQKNTSEFTPELFDLLRVITTAGSDDKLNDCIGRFLKAYDGYFGSKRTMNSIAYQLSRVMESIPKSYRAAVQEAMDGLVFKEGEPSANAAQPNSEFSPIGQNGELPSTAADYAGNAVQNTVQNAVGDTAQSAEQNGIGNTADNVADTGNAAQNVNTADGTADSAFAANNASAAQSDGTAAGIAPDNASADNGAAQNIAQNAVGDTAQSAEQNGIGNTADNVADTGNAAQNVNTADGTADSAFAANNASAAQSDGTAAGIAPDNASADNAAAQNIAQNAVGDSAQNNAQIGVGNAATAGANGAPQNIPEGFAQVKNYASTVLDDSVIENNLAVLKEKVLPALARYVSAFNDFGQTRDKISLIIHDISRLNVGTKTELMARFEELIDYMKYEMNVPAKQLGTVRQMFDNAIKLNSETNNKFIDALAKLLLSDRTTGLTATSQNMVKDVVQSVLLDYSTYMPYNHLFLPVNYNNKQLYTDIWVEKEPESDKKGGVLPRKIYINFEISNMGSFQAVIGILNDDVDCKLYLPDRFKREIQDVNRDVGRIFANVGYENAKVSSVAENVDIKSAIIKRIGERGDSINVTV